MAQKPKHLRYFYDQECKIEVPQIDDGNGGKTDRLDFVQPVTQGEPGTQVIFVRNESGQRVHGIRYTPTEKELDMVATPDVLEHGQVGKVTMTWHPSKDRQTAMLTDFLTEYKRIVT